MNRAFLQWQEWRWRWRTLAGARFAAAMAVLVLAVFGTIAATGGVARADWWFEEFGLSRRGLLEGRVWQVLSYALLHGNWTHALLNAALVWLLGARVEQILGWRAAAGTLAAGVLGGAAGHLLLGPGGQAAPLLVGISGGVCGWLLLTTTLSPQSRMFPLPLSARNLGLGVLLAELAFTLTDPALGIPGLGGIGGALERSGHGDWYQVAHACHLGGAGAGWLCGRAILRPRVSLEKLKADRRRREGPP